MDLSVRGYCDNIKGGVRKTKGRGTRREMEGREGEKEKVRGGRKGKEKRSGRKEKKEKKGGGSE